MSVVNNLYEELKEWQAKLNSANLGEYERRLIECEVAYIQKQIQDKQPVNKKQYA